MKWDTSTVYKLMVFYHGFLLLEGGSNLVAKAEAAAVVVEVEGAAEEEEAEVAALKEQM